MTERATGDDATPAAEQVALTYFIGFRTARELHETTTNTHT